MSGKKRQRKTRKPKQHSKQPPVPVPASSLWYRIPKWIYLMAAILAVVVTLAEAIPWLAVQEGSLLDSANPYSEMFKVVNSGYIPVTNLDALCTMNGTFGHDHLIDVSFGVRDFAGYLAHDGYATVPCFRLIRSHGGAPNDGATLDITIKYSYSHLTYRKLRRAQTFHFKSVAGDENSQHWVFIS
jgi:hypothetical protein